MPHTGRTYPPPPIQYFSLLCCYHFIFKPITNQHTGIAFDSSAPCTLFFKIKSFVTVTTTDAIASATGDAVAGVGEVADSIVGAVVGDAAGAAGVLSFLPSWLVSGGLVALGSELAFAVFAIFVLLNAGGISDSDGVESVGDDVVLKEKDTPLQGSHEETLTTFPDEETEL